MKSIRTRFLSSRGAVALLATFSLAAGATAAPDELALQSVTTPAVAHFESKQVMTGASATVGKAGAPGGIATIKRSTRTKAADALTLHWNDAWYSALRLETKTALDMRPYTDGVMALDLKVTDLAKGGIQIKTTCGKDCERKVAYVLPGREIIGKGWKHLAIPMHCFVREGDDFSAVSLPFEIDAGGSGEIAVANVKLLKKGKGNTPCPDYKTVSVTPDMLNEAWAIDWWLPRHQLKLAEIKRRKDAGEKTKVVFIGDSITEGWEKEGKAVWERNFKKYNGLALGFGGDRTENVLWRLQHGEVDGIDPQVAVLMFGTNNTGHRQEDPATIAIGIKRNIDELRKRLPNTKILLLAIFPREEKPGLARAINDKVNTILPGFADNKHVFFLNINQEFLDANGGLSKEIMPDFLHPNEKGYEIWARAMTPELVKLMESK
jgi:lysophospholipase L1-like esterase